jgi:REP element-mobilizing transposase RayT
MTKYKKRKSPRLSGHNYSKPGWYFITLTVKYRGWDFGRIVEQKIVYNKAGKIAKALWLEIPNRYESMYLDEYVIMPDHIHGIIQIVPKKLKNQTRRLPKTKKSGGVTGYHNPMLQKQSISNAMRWFTGRVTFEVHRNHSTEFQWQRRFYDHIIRNQDELNRIRKYIRHNPKQWKEEEHDLDSYLKREF